MPPYRITIAGAGPVGLAAAALLCEGPAAAQLQIEVIDAGGEPQWDEHAVDLRVYALSSAAQRVLDAAGALPGIAQRRMSPYERMHVWEGGSGCTSGRLDFDSADVGAAFLGHIVEDNLIRYALLERIRRHANVSVRLHCGFESARTDERGIRVAVAGNPRERRAHLLIGADGAQSRVRDAMHVRSVARDYGQQGLVAHVATQHAHRRTAWQRFLPGGPLALLPLADGRCSIVWSLPEADARRLRGAAPHAFNERLTEASANALGRLELDSDRVAIPLVARYVHEYCRERVALIGDAAHSVHPLAGQGVNLGLADAAELAEQIAAAVLAGQDPGDLRVLRRYERARKARNLLMLGALDGLDRLFRAPPFLAPLRTAGLNLVNAVPLLRNEFVRYASGESAP